MLNKISMELNFSGILGLWMYSINWIFNIIVKSQKPNRNKSACKKCRLLNTPKVVNLYLTFIWSFTYRYNTQARYNDCQGHQRKAQTADGRLRVLSQQFAGLQNVLALCSESIHALRCSNYHVLGDWGADYQEPATQPRHTQPAQNWNKGETTVL